MDVTSEYSSVGAGREEMMRLPESERLDYMVRYAELLEGTGDASRRHIERLENEIERLRGEFQEAARLSHEYRNEAERLQNTLDGLMHAMDGP